MKYLHVLTCVALCTAFACMEGCSTVQAKFSQDVQAATVPDLQAAIADAKAANDQDGLDCWTDVLNYVEALPTSAASNPLPAISGVASGLEAARIGAQALNGASINVIPPIPPKLHKDCAVLVVDSQQLALKLGISAAALGKAGATIKAAATLKALEAAGPVH